MGEPTAPLPKTNKVSFVRQIYTPILSMGSLKMRLHFNVLVWDIHHDTHPQVKLYTSPPCTAHKQQKP